jgi:hypothetical protein
MRPREPSGSKTKETAAVAARDNGVLLTTTCTVVVLELGETGSCLLQVKRQQRALVGCFEAPLRFGVGSCSPVHRISSTPTSATTCITAPQIVD